jgi:hypothetical protein
MLTALQKGIEHGPGGSRQLNFKLALLKLGFAKIC